MSPARGTRVRAARYADVQRWVRETYGHLPSSAWIAHVKALHGLQPSRAANRRRRRRAPCPPDKRAHVAAALRHFGVISQRLAPVDPPRFPP